MSNEVIWLILESLAQHQQLSSDKIKSNHARHDHPTHEPQSFASSSSSRADDHKTNSEVLRPKLRLPISPAFLKTCGISKVLPHSLGRDAILEAELGLLEFQKRMTEQGGEEESNEEPSEVRTIDLFRDLRAQCEVLSPFAGNQATSVRSPIHQPFNDRTRPLNDDALVGEVKGPGRDKLTSLVDYSIPLLLDPTAFEAQMRAYGDLHERSHTLPDVLPGPSTLKRAKTVLDARLMIYFVGLIQSFGTYLLKGVARVVEREPTRSSVKPHDLLVFIGEDELMTGFWDLFELTRTKSLIERLTPLNAGGSYHHRSGSFGLILRESANKKGFGIGSSTNSNSNNGFAYLFKTHSLYVAALQPPTTSRPEPYSHTRALPRKSNELPKRGQSSDIYRASPAHFSTGSVSSPAAPPSIPLQTALSPRSIATAVHPHSSHRKQISRKASKSTSTTSSSSHYSHYPLGQLEHLLGETSSPPSLASHSGHSYDTEAFSSTNLRRGPSLGKRAMNDRTSSTVLSTREPHRKKGSESSASNRDASADSGIGDAAARSVSSTSTSSNASSPPLRKASFTNLNQRFTSMIQGQGQGRSRSKTAGSVSIVKHSTSSDFSAARFPPPPTPSIPDEADRRDFMNINPRSRFKSFGADLSTNAHQPPSEEILDQPHLDAFEQLITSGRTMKVSLTPGRFRFPADKQSTSPKTLGSPNSPNFLLPSAIDTSPQNTRPITAPASPLEPRTEPRLLRKRVLEQAGRPVTVSVSRSASGLSEDAAWTESEGEEIENDTVSPRAEWMRSLTEMLKGPPPWMDGPVLQPDPSVSSAFPDSPPLVASQSKLKGLVSFSMKKSGSGHPRRRPGGSSINLNQISEPGLLYSSTAVSAIKTESLQRERPTASRVLHASQSALDHIEPLASTPAEDADEAKTKRRTFKSMLAKLKGKDDVFAGIRQGPPQFVSSSLGGVNPRMKAAKAIRPDFSRASAVTSPPHPTQLRGIPPVPTRMDGQAHMLRPQKSSPIMGVPVADAKPASGPRSATYATIGFESAADEGSRTKALSPPSRTPDIRAMRSSFESTLANQSHSEGLPAWGARTGWEMNAEGTLAHPPVPCLPASLRPSYDSTSSSAEPESTQAHVHSPIVTHGRGQLLTPPPTEDFGSVKQRTITSGSNSSEASNQTIKLLQRAASSSGLHPLLTPPGSAIESRFPLPEEDIGRRASATSSTARTPALTATTSSRASTSTTHTSCTSELLRQECNPAAPEEEEEVIGPGSWVPGEQVNLPGPGTSDPSGSRLAECMNLRMAEVERGSEDFTKLKSKSKVFGTVMGEEEENLQDLDETRWVAIEALGRVKVRMSELVGDGRVLVGIDEVMEVIETELRSMEREEDRFVGPREKVVNWLLDT
ncbi:hypothetical protein CROQUDRAFT_131224 [Cronartium quercuum f. sp. fusiforme G11]|uniref:Uncharacterized protein n=1 Tax=Cronartium quercuum f. sp. fusiforme G11 TaxID=708437 RepID=A0A9P6NSH7_9BASI|nr:hypothetical protein CROQUDRAFT_131224 [Cronartium quercuum f. sp. fusiforme G11]